MQRSRLSYRTAGITYNFNQWMNKGSIIVETSRKPRTMETTASAQQQDKQTPLPLLLGVCERGGTFYCLGIAVVAGAASRRRMEMRM